MLRKLRHIEVTSDEEIAQLKRTRDDHQDK